MPEDARVRLAREQYGVDASALYKALDEMRAADRMLAAKLFEWAADVRRFVETKAWQEK
jgi:hypothetical protein